VFVFVVPSGFECFWLSLASAHPWAIPLAKGLNAVSFCAICEKGPLGVENPAQPSADKGSRRGRYSSF